MERHFTAWFRYNDRYFSKRAWLTADNLDEGPRPDMFGAADAIREIERGTYHAIVVVDCAHDETEFFDKFGSHLQKFVELGGVVAFPTSQGGLISNLGSLFGVSWKRHGRLRAWWTPCEENMSIIQKNFGNGRNDPDIIQSYVVNGNAIHNVPLQERCFCVTKDSKTQPAIPIIPSDPDTIVAVHDYGMGCISYLGDVSGEDQTIKLVDALISSRSPEEPIDCWTKPLTDVVLGQVLKAKEQGNILVKNGDMQGAFVSYQSAVAKYNGTRGKKGEERDTLISLHSNSGLVTGMLKKWEKSEVCATKALELNPKHFKSLYRRALARYHMSQKETFSYFALKLLGKARKDLMKITPGDPDTEKDRSKLLQRIEHEIKRLKNQDREEEGEEDS